MLLAEDECLRTGCIHMDHLASQALCVFFFVLLYSHSDEE